MLARAGLLLGLALALGCKAEAPEPETDAEAPAKKSAKKSGEFPSGSRVVIAEQATLYTAARRDAETFQLSMPVDAPEPRAPGRIAEVLGIEGEFIAVRTLALQPADACAGTFASAQDYELRFFVLPDALLPVLLDTKVVKLDNGAKLELAPGVPVIGDDEISVGGESLFVDLENSELSRWFVSSSAAPEQLPTVGWDKRFPLVYGDRSITPTSELFELAHERRPVEGGTLLTFYNSCGAFTLLGKEEHDEFDPNAAHEAQIARLLAGQRVTYSGCAPTRWRASAETLVRWKSGGEAGFVRRSHALPSDASEDAERVCFDLGGAQACIAKDQLQRNDDDPCADAFDELVDAGTAPPITHAADIVSEGLGRDIIERIVRAHYNELRACYDADLQREPSLTGQITIAFEIGKRGKVSSSKVKTSELTPADVELDECVQKLFERWQFPKPSASSVRVEYSLQFGR